MFSLKLDDPKILTSSIGVISDFISEATFSFKKEGIKLVAMDPANISMVILDILPSAFTEYDVKEEQEITINLDNLKQALKRVRPGEILNIESAANKLKISITGRSSKEFLIPLLEKEGKDRKIPELEFNSIMEVDSNEFKEFVEDAAVVDDALVFETNGDTFLLKAGDAGSKLCIELKKGSDALSNIDSKSNSKSIYSVEYLKKMAKSASLSNIVKMGFSSDYPLRLDFVALNKGQMSFVLAPRIENK